MRMYDLIVKKRDGKELSGEEIEYFVRGYTEGVIPDYQASAMLMAIFLNGMSRRETVDLTYAMMNSGDVLDLSAIEGIKVDKHSTGGVGDTTTLVLAPLVASCGIPVAKMSGRGLGHTGGTIDKLESIEGFRTEMDMARFIDHVNRKKIAIIGQSKNIAPADKKIYALRDVTGTVENISLIASSVMSKKLAAGSDAVVLDVKTGSGAFIKDLDGALELASEMVGIGTDMKRNTVALITDMDQPLGFAIGNALEVKEAVDTLRGEGPEDLTGLCLELGAYMVLLGGGADTYEAARAKAEETLRNGGAYQKFREFVEAQGGDPHIADDPARLIRAGIRYEVKAPQDGYIAHINSEEAGISAMLLGAGRESLESRIDLSAGIMLTKKPGDRIHKGDVVGIFHTNRAGALEAAEKRFLAAFTVAEEPPEKAPLIKVVVTKDGIRRFV